MKIHYLEFVSTDPEGVRSALEAIHGVSFGPEDPLLGGARTAEMSDGCVVGVRAPMAESEAPVVRPYWRVSDIESALAEAADRGAEVAHPPLEIPGRGTFAIFFQGGVQQGLWQV